ncbi:hypothetical protein [Bosea sp. LjRoot237]|uniref:hypothetical protein n=1 Tax=Bosea sp. LjRoot237 TaxID=3342292 RepID=UPI003ECD8D5B
MPGKPSTSATVLDVLHVIISEDPTERTIIKLAIEGSTNVDLMFDPLTLAKLQAILIKVDSLQAQAQTTQ